MGHLLVHVTSVNLVTYSNIQKWQCYRITSSQCGNFRIKLKVFSGLRQKNLKMKFSISPFLLNQFDCKFVVNR